MSPGAMSPALMMRSPAANSRGLAEASYPGNVVRGQGGKHLVATGIVRGRRRHGFHHSAQVMRRSLTRAAPLEQNLEPA